jgi:hypothetical protein
MFKVLITKFTEELYFLRSCQSECAVCVFTVLFNGQLIVFSAYCNKITIGTLSVCNLKGHMMIEELLYTNVFRNSITGSRSQWVCGLRCGSVLFTWWDCGFESWRGHGCFSLVGVVCCQVEVSALGWPHIQGSPTECGVSDCDFEALIPGDPDPLGAVVPWICRQGYHNFKSGNPVCIQKHIKKWM